MYPPKSFFQRLVESAALFALACWLVRTGICLIRSVWGWIILAAVLIGIIFFAVTFYRFYKKHRF